MATKKKIGRYKIISELGRGAMGVVYKAEDPNLDRMVALKTIILAENSEGRAEYQKRFMLEAKAAGKLNHPSIVTTFDYGEHEGMAYLAMELLEGTDLRTRLQKESFPAAESIEIARQVAEGLAYAHARGVVHRDIKPGNIMLNGGGQAKIMDFGLARMRMADHKTSTGMVLGTPRYMSPEQISGQPVDQRSDIFSLGIVLYEMLTGTRLYAGESMEQVQHLIIETEHVPPTRQVAGLPPMVDFIVARALKKDPSVRYQDARELAADLAACAAELRSNEVSNPSGSKTVKLEVAPEKVDAPAARMIANDTRLPVSRLFDAAPALRRLKDAALTRAPRHVGLFRRIYRDAAVRQLFIALVVAGAAGAYLAVGAI
ncbi:MAG TPA: serine/threonine-protein kinase [Burkholderiales bacterium]|nr:serine/threonine-protein kinase [Burkholderiales bacterium]